MKVLLLNLPHAAGRLQRRYVASYYAPNFLVPPLELMGLGAIARQWKGCEVELLDAIAADLDEASMLAALDAAAPDVVVSLLGFGCFSEDVGYLESIRAARPDVKLVGFGYLPTQRPEEVMANTSLDALLLEEPEYAWSGYLDLLQETADDPAAVPGLVSRQAVEGGDTEVVRGQPAIRLTGEQLDALPFPDHGLIDREAYSESYLGRPIAAVLSARGCPFQCTYCVRMFGKKFVTRSAENILDELEVLVREQGIRNIRFMDDTFTLDPKRLKAICQGMLDRELGLRWTCLTRLDCLDEEGLRLMKRAGCKRMYCGVESGSQRMLDRFKKGAKVDVMAEQIRLARRAGIEVSAFFIVGAPGETDEDFDQSVRFAIDTGVDYVIVTRMQYWPGTELYDGVTGDLDFSLFPFSVKYEPDADDNFYRREKAFYRRFYLRPRYAIKRIPNLIRTPGDIARGFFELVRYVGSKDPDRDFI